jgi:hypothetical protein
MWDLRAHSRQSIISRITVNGNDTKYAYIDHLSGITHRTHDGGRGPTYTTKLRGQALVKDLNARDLETFHHTFADAIAEADMGELSIDMSKADKRNPSVISVVTIHFKLQDPETGVTFSGADEQEKDAQGYPIPTHCYTFRSRLSSGSIMGNGDGARCCFPCVDNVFVRCPWTLTFQVSKGVKVFATGTLMEKDTKTSATQDELVFHIHERVCAHSIGYAIGHFRNAHVNRMGGRGSSGSSSGRSQQGSSNGGSNDVTPRNSTPSLNFWVLGDALVEDDEKMSTTLAYQEYHNYYSKLASVGGDNVAALDDAEEEKRSKKAARKEVERTVANTMAALPQAIAYVRKWLNGDVSKLKDETNPNHPGPTLPFHNRMTVVYVQGAPIQSTFMGAGLVIIGEDADPKFGGLLQEAEPDGEEKIHLVAFAARIAAWSYFVS